MTIQEPAWLRRSKFPSLFILLLLLFLNSLPARPCPFFSQGRCLFADSCSFLHDVKVRSALLPSASHAKLPSLSPKPVFVPPSVVVNSPGSVDLASPASPIQDSSRYSGLLSVLSDVIGPPSNPPTTTEDAASFQSIAHDPTTVSDFALSDIKLASTVTHMDQGSSSYAEPSSILQPDPEATLVDPPGFQMDYFFPEEDSEPVAQFLDDTESANGDTTYCFVGNTETYAVGSESDNEEDTSGYGEEDFTVRVSNRQSTLSSFTGASLLASPRNSSLIEDGAVDLLSPVQLSANLRPFPIPSLGSMLKRGDSIDSGYADGDSWLGPLPFPRSPPRSFRSPATFPSHSSPTLGKVSSSVGVPRLSPHNLIEGIKEVESDGSSEPGSEDNTAYIILDNDASPSDEHGAHDPSQVNVNVVTEEKAVEDEIPAVMRSSRRYSPDHLRPTREQDLDLCNQSSFISDYNLSFRTALSAQPSYRDLSDISQVSPIKQDSLLPSISGCSTPDTSVLSHYSDASEALGHPIVGLHTYRSSYPVPTELPSQIDSTGVSRVRASEQSSLPEEVAINSNVLFPSAITDELQELALEKVVAAQEPLSGVFPFDRHSLLSSPPVDTSHRLSLTKNDLAYVPLGADNIRQSALQKVVTLQGRLSGAFHIDRHPPNLSPSAEISHSPLSVRDASSRVCPGTDDLQDFAPDNAVAPRERLPSILPYDRSSPKSNPSMESSCSPPLCNLSSISRFDGHSPRLSSPEGSSSTLFLANDVPNREPHDEDVRYDGLPVDVVAPGEDWPGVDKHLPTSISSAESPYSGSISVQDILGCTLLGVGGAQVAFPEITIASEEYASGVLHLDRPSLKPGSLPESSYSLDVLSDAPPSADGGKSGSPLQSPIVLHGYPAECATGQRLAHEDSFASDETTEYFESDCDDFTQRLSFPLPPPFLPAGLIGSSTLGGEDTSVLPETIAVNLEEVQRMRSSSDLTEKVQPSQLPLAGCPNSDAELTFRRDRAASDLTVKGKSPPVTTPEGTPYNQHFHDGTADDCSIFSSPVHKVIPLSDASNTLEEPSQEVRLQSLDLMPYVFQRESSLCSDSKRSNSDADSPPSETFLRPLLTGRRSFPCSSLTEFVPKAGLESIKDASSPCPSIRLQTREIGSTMVPLGFWRHNPQVHKRY